LEGVYNPRLRWETTDVSSILRSPGKQGGKVAQRGAVISAHQELNC